MLKKACGITRNRNDLLAASRLALHKKKNRYPNTIFRFKYVNKDD